MEYPTTTLTPFSQGLRFDGQVVMVTGAASGIGRAVAEDFADQGACLILLDRSEAVLETAATLGSEHLGLICDVTSRNQIQQAMRQIDARWGHLDVLVNNAGVALLDAADQICEADWDRTLAVNLKAPFFLAQAAAPLLARHRRGRIINLASQAAVVALPRHAAYCASKAALVSLTQVLALEWAERGITVNAISPTVVETALGRQAWAGHAGDAMRQRIPTGRFAQPEEIAAAALFLASPHAAMINGANLVIDGGYTIQ
ncbi:MAG: D-threitol dehydrogenase [Curvibacter sp.]|nr:D-threitol dehydrogenase [Curvibacter sp.]